jgi:hypothetical protein
MTELIEKVSYEAKQVILRQLLQELLDDKATIEQSMEAISCWYKADVELAYKAGMLHFNALDHTMRDPREHLERKCFPWSSERATIIEQTLNVGEFATNTSLYLKAKGFKP